MSKTYTKRTFEARNYTNNEAYNDEANNVLAEFNGKLSADQLPYQTVERENFVANSRIAVDSLPDGSAQDGVGLVMSTQAIYEVKSNLDTFTWDRLQPSGSGPVSVLGPPLAVWNSSSSDWSSGIISLSDKVPRGTFLRFTSKEGVMKGIATVDIEYYFVSSSATGFSGNYGAGWRWQLYVFANDVMVATSGPQPAGRRRTVQLPFTIPVSSQDAINLDVRWSGTFDGAGTSPNDIVTVQDAAIRFYNCQLWARNQYR